MKKIILLFMIAATILALTACGRPSLSEEEAVRVIRPLVEKAEVLNEIYFGGGIPVEDSTARLHAFFDATGLKEETATYLPVSRDSLYQTKNALLAETKTVFTAAYAAYLEELGFRGIQDGDPLGQCANSFAGYTSLAIGDMAVLSNKLGREVRIDELE